MVTFVISLFVVNLSIYLRIWIMVIFRKNYYHFWYKKKNAHLSAVPTVYARLKSLELLQYISHRLISKSAPKWETPKNVRLPQKINNCNLFSQKCWLDSVIEWKIMSKKMFIWKITKISNFPPLMASVLNQFWFSPIFLV